MVKRPLIWILCFFMIGIICNKYICSVFYFIPIVFLTCLGVFHFFYYLKHKYSVSSDSFLFLLPFVLILGYFLPYYYSLHNQLPEKVLHKKAMINGKIEKIIQKPSFQELYLSDVTILQENDRKFLRQFLIQDPDKRKAGVGDRIDASGEIAQFEKATNPGQFDSYSYYEAKGIRYCMREGKITKLVPGKWKIYRILEQVKTRISRTYQQLLPEEDSEILNAMILGDKSELSSEIKMLYQKAGISHLLAISGLHISIIGLFLFRMLKKAGLHHNLASAICIVLVYLYGVMTGFSVSTNRAVIMMCLALSACLINRTYDSKSALAASGIWILIQQPYQLFQCGFMLSFLAVAAVVWFVPICKDYLQWLFPEFDSKMELKDKSEYHSLAVLIHSVLKLFRSSFLVSCCIQCVTLPVLLCNFYEFACLSPVLNLFVLPVSTLLMIMSVFVGCIGSLCRPVGFFLSGSVHSIFQFYHVLCDVFQKIPGQNVIIGCPKIWQVSLYFLLVAGFCYIASRKLHKYAGVLLLAALVLLLFRVPETGLQITMLDVGQGDCIYWKNDNGITCLMDGGSTSVSAVGTYRIQPFLKYKGVKRLDYCFVSHMDEDHINGIQELISASMESGGIQIGSMVFPRIRNEDDAYLTMIKQAKSAHIRIVYIERGRKITSEKMQLTCLHPDYEFLSEDRNSASLVLELSYKGFSMLFTGDVDEKGESYMLSHSGELASKYDVLKVAHHGSKSSSCMEWLEHVKPENAFISCGKKNRYGHPGRELLERLQTMETKAWRTDRQGALLVQVNGKGYHILEYGSS